MRFFWDNFIDHSAVNISATTEEAKLPVANLQHAHKKKLYRTTGAGTSETVLVDLGSAKAIDGSVFLNHTFDGSESAINIEGNASDSWGSPSFSEAVVMSGADPSANKFSSAQTFQWWRFEFTKASAANVRDIGRMFLGDVFDTAINPSSNGFDDEAKEMSQEQRSIDGQTYSYIKDGFLKIRVSFSAMSLADAKQLKTIFDAVGSHTPLFIQVDPTASDGIREVIHYVKFSKALKRKVHSFDSELKWDINLEFEEQL